ncbi:hypothetical protein [Gemmatirosa kalamazoonensis]|uniref:hypothetical protein n=1 Tax=Gemmatirosa kalamazoonensis TaxID=861299 RepID=UPI0011DD93A7|nr:hypothetical protein [Gemmatirosa kalamazoonensis]
MRALVSCNDSLGHRSFLFELRERHSTRPALVPEEASGLGGQEEVDLVLSEDRQFVYVLLEVLGGDSEVTEPRGARRGLAEDFDRLLGADRGRGYLDPPGVLLRP